MIFGLSLIMLAVLLCPFLFKKIEKNLEAFLFVMGMISVTVAGVWSWNLVKESLYEPVPITFAVFVAGVIFKYTRRKIRSSMSKILNIIPEELFVFLTVVILGLISSMITAIIAALILVEIISGLNLNKDEEISITVVACFSIGLGAALTPVGEPLSTILVAKLKELPHVNFWYPFNLLGMLVIPGIFVLGFIAIFFKGKRKKESLYSKPHEETFKEVINRALKVYLFVMALIFLGGGFKPFIDEYVVKLNSKLLFWINMVSAVLDNATLTAAEISPKMSEAQIKAVTMGLLISGGMLIPGNIPNIISANKLKISSRKWAAIGIPLGLALMAIYFFLVFFVVS